MQGYSVLYKNKYWKMEVGNITGVLRISDIKQGINEVKLGWRNDRIIQTKTTKGIRCVMETIPSII